MHCFERYIIRVDETRDPPRRDEATKCRSNNNPTAAWFSVKHSSIALGQPLRREFLAGRLVSRGTNFPQAIQRLAILAPRGLRQDEGVLRLLRFARGNQWIDCDKSRHLSWMYARVEQAQCCSPRVAY